MMGVPNRKPPFGRAVCDLPSRSQSPGQLVQTEPPQAQGCTCARTESMNEFLRPFLRIGLHLTLPALVLFAIAIPAHAQQSASDDREAIKQLLKRVEQLEARIKELESRQSDALTAATDIAAKQPEPSMARDCSAWCPQAGSVPVPSASAASVYPEQICSGAVNTCRRKLSRNR